MKKNLRKKEFSHPQKYPSFPLLLHDFMLLYITFEGGANSYQNI
jgi:hypothetical protein